MMFELNRGLEPLKNSPKFKFGTWDVEASDWWTLVLIGIWDGERYAHFRNVADFFEFILQHKYNGWRFFAHFGGRYDMNFIFDYLRTRHDIGCSFYCAGSMVLEMSLTFRKVTVHLRDSFRLFYMPGNLSDLRTDNKNGLRALGIAFNVEHQKTDLDFGNVQYNRELIAYNEQDCRCLYEVMDRFFIETGVQAETFASHALRLWRKDFLQETIWKPRPEVSELARQSYCGGRVEIFKKQHSNLTAYDVNSMYPFVMMQPMPTEYVGESRQLTDQYYGFIECTITIPDMYTPCLPVRGDKLYFPVGTVRGVWTVEELLQSESQGCAIQKIHKAFYFRTSGIFQGYVEKLYALKKTAGEPTRTIAKGLLNALYGKFGQNPEKKVYCTERHAPEGSIPIITPEGYPSGFCYYTRISRAAYLLPHLSSAVTSKARLHLYSQLNQQSYYCDTDSVFTTDTIPVSKELGGWGLVGSGEAQFIQAKLYKFKGVWKSKGLGKDQSIDDYIAGNRNMVQRAKSIREALRDGSTSCVHVVIEKMLRESRPKRADDGENDTRPWNWKELQ